MIEEKNMSKIIKRMLYWVDWYESKSTDTRKDDVGIFADFNKDTLNVKTLVFIEKTIWILILWIVELDLEYIVKDFIGMNII